MGDSEGAAAGGPSLLQMMHYESIPKNFQWEFKPQLWPIMPWAATIDGSPNGLVDTPTAMIKEGTFNRVPVIAGTNRDEGVVAPVLCARFPSFSLSTFKQHLECVFHEHLSSPLGVWG